MKESTASRLLWTFVLSTLCLIGVVIFQLDALEERAVAHNQQLRLLGEAAERTAFELKRLQAGGSSGATAATGSAAAGCELGQLLHPEVKDFLSERDTHWPPPGAPTSGELRVGWSRGDPKGFNWMIENAAELGSYIVNYADTALADRNRWTDPNVWHGEVACRVEITDDFKEFTIYLRRGIKWHVPSAVDVNDPKFAWLKGEHELTAHDYVFMFDMLQNPQVENGFAKQAYQDLESWRAHDDYTLVVRWKRRTYLSTTATLGVVALPRFLYAFSQDGKPYPKETLGLRFNQHWYNNKGYVGAGAYRFVRYQPGQSIVLERNEEFFGEKPAISRISYPIYTDQTQTVLRLKANELNFASLQAGQYREEFLQWQDKPKQTWPNSPFLNGTLRCEVINAPVFDYIGWNGAKPLFADPRVRTAMTLALRRKEIVEKVFAGLGEVAMGPYIPETGYHDPTVDPLEFNLERAKALLAEAGFSDSDGDGLLDKQLGGVKQPFEFTLLIYGSSQEYLALANIFKDDLIKIGVRLKIEAAEWSLMQKRMDEKKFDAFTGAWGLSWDTDPYQIWHSSQADVPKGSNRIGFRNTEVDSLIEQLRGTFDETERRQMLRKVHRIIYDAQAYTFVRRRKDAYCWHSSVKNVVFAKARPQADFFPWYVEGGP
jgi:ABC-type transport system substrate-binding protein